MTKKSENRLSKERKNRDGIEIMANRLSDMVREFNDAKEPKLLMTLAAQLFEELGSWVDRYEDDPRAVKMFAVTLALIMQRLEIWRAWAAANPDEVPPAHAIAWEQIVQACKDLEQEHTTPGVVTRTLQ